MRAARRVRDRDAHRSSRPSTLEPDWPKRTSRSACCKLGGVWDWQGAARAFHRAIELDPAHALARIYLSWVQVLLGDFERGAGRCRAGPGHRPAVAAAQRRRGLHVLPVARLRARDPGVREGAGDRQGVSGCAVRDGDVQGAARTSTTTPSADLERAVELSQRDAVLSRPARQGLRRHRSSSRKVHDVLQRLDALSKTALRAAALLRLHLRRPRRLRQGVRVAGPRPSRTAPPRSTTSRRSSNACRPIRDSKRTCAPGDWKSDR